MILMKIKALLLVAAISVCLSTCTSDVYNPDVCFQENILPIFVSKCGMPGCHNSVDLEHGYDLTNYEGIMKGVKPKHPLLSEVYKVISGNNPSMPPGPKLDQKEITYIKIWIKMGAKNTSNCNSCDTSRHSYSGRIAPLMTTWCVGCHNSESAGGGYDLSDYNGVATAISTNRFSGAVNHLSGFIPMPQNTAKLNDCDVNAINSWIAEGYPNN